MDDEADMLDEFRRVMVNLHIVYKNNFPDAKIDYWWEAQWIHHTVGSMPWDAWKHDDVLKQLEEIERALRILSHVYELPQAIHDAISFDAFHRSKGIERDISKGEVSPSDASLILHCLYDELAPSIRAAKLAVRQGERKGRTNWEEVTAIDACRISWWRCTSEEAPGGSDLNLASSFGEFVQDIFDAMEIDGKPRSAMDAWRRVQRKAENT